VSSVTSDLASGNNAVIVACFLFFGGGGGALKSKMFFFFSRCASNPLLASIFEREREII